MKTPILFLVVLAAASVVAQTPRPELKGDTMGMGLSEFTAKHRREISKSETAPPTSLTYPGMFPESIRDPTLGVVAAKLYFPFEERYDSIRQDSTPLTTIATIPAHIDYYFMRSRTDAKEDPGLYHIRARFGVSGYSTVRDALITKYGEAKTIENNTLHNRMGASFENVVSTWEFEQDAVILTKFSDNLDTSLLEFRDKARVAEFLERLKEKSKKNADDL